METKMSSTRWTRVLAIAAGGLRPAGVPKTRWVLALTAMTIVGCQSASSPDAGSEIIVPDGALPVDAAVGDAGASPDAGGGTCGMISESSGVFPPLPTSCVPLCDDAARAALAACAPLDFRCRRDAVPFGDGPIVRVDGLYGEASVSCGGSRTGDVWPCFGWQETSCEADYCTDQYVAYISCLNRGDVCTAEDQAVLACLESSAEYQACVVERIRAC